MHFPWSKRVCKNIQVLGLILLKQSFYNIPPVQEDTTLDLSRHNLTHSLYAMEKVQKSLHQISRYWIMQIQNSA